MKQKRKRKIITAITLFIMAIAIITSAVFLLGRKAPPTIIPDSGSESDISEKTVSLPLETESGSESSEVETEEDESEIEISEVEIIESEPQVDFSEPEPTEKEDILIVEAGGETEEQTDTNNKEKNDIAKPTEKPVETVKPKEPIKKDDQLIFGDAPTEKYNCGSPNHNCKNEEFHAYLINLELEGCVFCGSHSCPSFYDLNEWGDTRLNRELCPKYDIKGDPTKYCQECERPLWSKEDPTGCFRYLRDTDCECGERVKGNTCHHH